MWLIVAFDLPVLTREDKRNYRKFVCFLEDEGFTRLQYSVLIRPTATLDSTDRHAKRIADNIPPYGQIRILRLTDLQWARTECFHNGRLHIPEAPPEQFCFFDNDDEADKHEITVESTFDTRSDGESERYPEQEEPTEWSFRPANPGIGIGRKWSRKKKRAGPDDQVSLFL